MVLYILTRYWGVGIVYLDQLTGARHRHIFYPNKDMLAPTMLGERNMAPFAWCVGRCQVKCEEHSSVCHWLLT